MMMKSTLITSVISMSFSLVSCSSRSPHLECEIHWTSTLIKRARKEELAKTKSKSLESIELSGWWNLWPNGSLQSKVTSVIARTCRLRWEEWTHVTIVNRTNLGSTVWKRADRQTHLHRRCFLNIRPIKTFDDEKKNSKGQRHWAIKCCSWLSSWEWSIAIIDMKMNSFRRLFVSYIALIEMFLSASNEAWGFMSERKYWFKFKVCLMKMVGSLVLGFYVNVQRFICLPW